MLILRLDDIASFVRAEARTKEEAIESVITAVLGVIDGEDVFPPLFLGTVDPETGELEDMSGNLKEWWKARLASET